MSLKIQFDELRHIEVERRRQQFQIQVSFRELNGEIYLDRLIFVQPSNSRHHIVEDVPTKDLPRPISRDLAGPVNQWLNRQYMIDSKWNWKFFCHILELFIGNEFVDLV